MSRIMVPRLFSIPGSIRLYSFISLPSYAESSSLFEEGKFSPYW
jgi:hypothetical protein